VISVNIANPELSGTCGRQASIEKRGGTVIKPEMLGWEQSYPSRVDPISTKYAVDTRLRPSLPPIQPDEELQHFRRIHISEPVEPVRDMDEALSRLAADRTDSAANVFLGLHYFSSWLIGPVLEKGHLGTAEYYFRAAVKSGIELFPPHRATILGN